MLNLTYLVLGPIDSVPSHAPVRSFPLASPNSPALYKALCDAVDTVETEFFCVLDGNPDILMPGFEASIEKRILEMQNTQAAIGYADEYRRKAWIKSGEFTLSNYVRNFTMIHHAAVCRTSAANQLKRPKGNFLFQGVYYGGLAQQGYVYDPTPVYQWNPSVNGARLWPDTQDAIKNSLMWLRGVDEKHFLKVK